MSREKVSINEIGDILGNNENQRTHQLRLRKKNGEYVVKRLHSDLAVPSYIHGYSLAIEYMRNWFIERIDKIMGKNYFKTVYINGKHVLDDYKNMNRQVIKRERPMVAIVPTVDFDHDRESLDLYMADPSMFLRRSNYQQSFFRDPERDLYLGVQFQELKMDFAYRMRVDTKAQQYDLKKKMELQFRVGATQYEYFSADFHIPKDIILSIAEKAGFKVDWITKNIDCIMDFIAYLNEHSDLPILYKMRAINQKSEFFIRVKDMYGHIACRDRITPDDGERNGHLDMNFHLDFATELKMPIPHFYVYYSQAPEMGSTTLHETEQDIVGLYSFNDFEIPEKNELGWYQVALTSYLCDKGENFIDLTEVFSGNTNLDIVMEYSLRNFISPQSFIDIQVFRNDDRACRVRTKMNFQTKHLDFLEEMDEEAINIVIYADRQYINETIISLNEYNKTRIEGQGI